MNGTKKSRSRETRSAPDGDSPSLSPQESHGQITQKLRAFYDSVQDEGIPDRFLDLLEKLDQAEKASESTENK